MAQSNNEKLPLFKSWRGWYSAVLVSLLLYIAVFYFFTRIFG